VLLLPRVLGNCRGLSLIDLQEQDALLHELHGVSSLVGHHFGRDSLRAETGPRIVKVDRTELRFQRKPAAPPCYNCQALEEAAARSVAVGRTVEKAEMKFAPTFKFLMPDL
jgi:hypothetical protein